MTIRSASGAHLLRTDRNVSLKTGDSGIVWWHCRLECPQSTNGFRVLEADFWPVWLMWRALAGVIVARSTLPRLVFCPNMEVTQASFNVLAHQEILASGFCNRLHFSLDLMA